MKIGCRITATKITRLHNYFRTLADNEFHSIPEVIFELRSLETLDISNSSTSGNKIKVISSKLLQLTELEELKIDSELLEEPPLEVASQGLSYIRNYFRQLETEGFDYLYEAKILILGEGGAGKTTLARKLKDRNAEMPEEDDTTRGIEVTKWEFPCRENKKFIANIWDFGGQEIYHHTHQFFLTKRSLYVLVADTRKDNTDFYFWLNVVELLTDNSPLLIIKNEKDNRPRDINESSLRGEFSNLKEILSTNLADLRGYDEMKEKITHFIENLPHIGSALPKSWVRVREALERNQRNYISIGEYLSICEQNGFERHEDKLQLSGYLHDIGVCLHFQDDPLLSKTIILKPKWGTNAVYKVLDDLTVVTNHGTFNKNDMKRIWGDEEFVEMREELLQLMMKFKLCYKIPDNTNYIAPQLLNGNQPEYEWDKNNNLFLQYKYDFMPKGILSQFIVIKHEWIADQKLVWKSGVVLEHNKTRAEVIEDYNKKVIRIRVVGSHKKRMMDIVSYELDKIHDSYKRLKYIKLIPCYCKTCGNDHIPHFYSFDTLLKFWEDRQDEIQCQNSYQMVNVRGLLDDVIQSPLFLEKNELGLSQKDSNLIIEKYLESNKQRQNSLIIKRADNVVVQQTSKGDNQMARQNNEYIRSPWASGSFYLFVFIIVITGLAVTSNYVAFSALPIVLIAACIFVPVIGALQLKQDARLSEKSFVELMKITVGQLPLLSTFFKKSKQE